MRYEELQNGLYIAFQVCDEHAEILNKHIEQFDVKGVPVGNMHMTILSYNAGSFNYAEFPSDIDISFTAKSPATVSVPHKGLKNFPIIKMENVFSNELFRQWQEKTKTVIYDQFSGNAGKILKKIGSKPHITLSYQSLIGIQNMYYKKSELPLNQIRFDKAWIQKPQENWHKQFN